MSACSRWKSYEIGATYPRSEHFMHEITHYPDSKILKCELWYPQNSKKICYPPPFNPKSPKKSSPALLQGGWRYHKYTSWKGAGGSICLESSAESREYISAYFWGMGYIFIGGMEAYIYWGMGRNLWGGGVNPPAPSLLDLHPLHKVVIYKLKSKTIVSIQIACHKRASWAVVAHNNVRSTWNLLSRPRRIVDKQAPNSKALDIPLLDESQSNGLNLRNGKSCGFPELRCPTRATSQDCVGRKQ